MKPLYTQEQFTNAKSEDKLPCECYTCENTFYKDKRTLNKVLNNISGHTGQFCSHKCKILFIGKNKQEVQCIKCKNFFEKYLNQIKKHPKNFCSQSCAANYNNTHKTTGIRRSKLESFLEQQLTSLYPNLKIDFNKKDAINSELDIYIPSLKLAFELNGIFHYEPIYGSNKLNQIQNNDHRKFQACAEQNISLCIIDTSKQKYFKESTSKEFLSIITDIINNISKNI
jgi:hypothetical protein